jgi:hypothetical protein
VAYGIHIQTSPRFMDLLPLKPNHPSVCPVSTLSWLQNSIAIKPWIGIGWLSNQRKAEFVNDNFGIQSFWGGHDKITSKSWFRSKGRVCLEFWVIKPVEFLTAVTRKPVTVWSHLMDHWKAERVFYRNGIRDLRSFGRSETQNLSSVQQWFCLETGFSR